MGSFFTNVQVQVPTGGELKAQKQVVKALQSLAKRAGLEALDAAHAHAGRPKRFGTSAGAAPRDGRGRQSRNSPDDGQGVPKPE